MVFGSTLIIKLMNRFAFIVYIGAAVILYTAGTMITDDLSTREWFEKHLLIRWTVIIVVTAGGLLFGYLFNRAKDRKAGEKRAEGADRDSVK
jgi:predicted tellurium resistance membrane protein TerC